MPTSAAPGPETREVLIKKLRKAYIPPGELRDRYSNIMGRWKSDLGKGGVSLGELRTLLDALKPSSEGSDSPA